MIDNLNDDTQEILQEDTQVEPERKQSDADRNFAQLRESKERIEREKLKAEQERDQALKVLKEVERYALEYQNKAQVSAPVDDHEDEEELVDKKYFNKKLEEKLKDIERRNYDTQQQVYLSQTESKLKQQYPDIEQVLSQSNIELLKQQEPEMASTITNNPDMYSKAVSAYRMIRALGIHKEEQHNQEKSVVQQNSVKPRSTASLERPTNTPLDKANAFAQGLTPELKKQFFQEALDAMKQR